MAIIGTLPNIISNGQAVDATPVMADFNFIVNQVNANANPTGTLTAPSGTRTIFHQAAAPLGWTQDASLTDHTLQVIGTAGGGTGGSTAYSSMFLNQWTADGHALTVGELAAHSHTDSGHTHTDAGHNHVQNGSTLYFSGPATVSTSSPSFSANTASLPTSVGNANITTSFANLQNTGSGTAHAHTKTFAAQYAAVIMAVKS